MLKIMLGWRYYAPNYAGLNDIFPLYLLNKHSYTILYITFLGKQVFGYAKLYSGHVSLRVVLQFQMLALVSTFF